MSKSFDALMQTITTGDTPPEVYDQLEDRLRNVFHTVPVDRDSIMRMITRFFHEVEKFDTDLPFIDWLEALAGTVDQHRMIDNKPDRRIAALIMCTTTDDRWSVPVGSVFCFHRSKELMKLFGLNRTAIYRSQNYGIPANGLMCEVVDDWPLFYHIDACWSLADIEDKAV